MERRIPHQIVNISVDLGELTKVAASRAELSVRSLLLLGVEPVLEALIPQVSDFSVKGVRSVTEPIDLEVATDVAVELMVPTEVVVRCMLPKVRDPVSVQVHNLERG